MRKFTHHEIVQRQSQKMRERRLPFCVLLNNIRSLHNVGAIFRTADGVGIEKIWLCGITGYPPRSEITKTALGAEKRIPWEYKKEATTVLAQLKKANYQIIFLEQMEESIPYQKFRPKVPCCLVMGNEITGVEEKLLPFGDAAIEIEMVGIKNSLNVAVAFGIVAYHIRNSLRRARV